jgi:tripartite-type tricarboxylate transporter receptor subunit TctC
MEDTLMRNILVRFGVFSVALVGLFAGESSWGQNYPVKAIRLIVNGPPSGGADVVIRPLAQKLSESLGQHVVVDNRPGAAGVISGQLTASSPPDGYTLLLTTASGFSIAPFLAKKLPYDPAQDFAPVTLVAIAPLMAAVHPSLPVRSVRDLINLAKARPRQLLYASNGTGAISHLTTEMFSQAAGISMVHVPYKGGTPAAMDTVGGQVQLVITAVPTLLTQVRASRLRALAVTSANRSSAVPDVPTVAESGLPGFESVQWFAIFAPKNTSTPVTEKLFGEIRKAAESPSVKAPLAQQGAEFVVNGPQALSGFLRTDMAKWQKVIRQANLVLE